MKITILAGSNRKQSTSTQLCRYIQTVLEGKECEVTLIDLNQSPVPIYSPDVEANDTNLLFMKQQLKDADGIVLATPEYHGAPSGVLKNALDHVGFEQFDGKVVLSVSSTGGAVGVSSLQQLQTIVRNVHGINCPEWISIGGDQRVFTPEGEPADTKVKDRVHRTVNYFVHMVTTFRG
ncbi:NADPH-dependent FMN reductase [Paenibacillus sp. NPDC056579]|uniref:NADPH-dependent FMN reductase n=1 Tax=unclassified Paenibacillus TaxID=185978 RepID=UPI001EF92066|nr:NADPH-dependent FMN reductase [Paenibacillus sp. H1-7]ULL14637.1 NADPH-dependent oxidoreductase [Paenibacillus sp. H1-7]